MERGIIIYLKKSGEQKYLKHVSDGDICNFGPGVECDIRFGMRQVKGVFCSISADEEGPVQLKKISECSVFVNGTEVEYETYLNFGDLLEIEGRTFIWKNSSLSDVKEKKSPVKRISSTTQIHGRKSINEFRASKKLYKSANTSRFWAESEENVLTDSKNQNTGFSVSSSPIRLTYLQNSPHKKSENYSFKEKLKNSTPKRTSVRTPKLRTPISENKTESVRRTPKSAIITPTSAIITPKSTRSTPKSARKTPKSAMKTPKSARKTPKSARKTPKSLIITPKSLRNTSKSAIITPKSVVKTPKSAIKTPNSAFKDEKLLIRTPRSTAKTPNSTIQTRKSALRTPKSTVMASTVLVKTPRLLRSEIKSSSSSKLLQLNKLQRKQSETAKYFENNTSMQLPTKIPRKYFFTPPTRTPRSNIRKIEGKAASVSLKVQKTKSPILAEKQSPVQNRSPKNVISINTPKSLQKLVSSTPKSAGKGSKQDKTPASSVKSPEEILKTPRSTRQRTLEATIDLESEATEIKPTDNINRSLQSSVLSAKSSPIFLPAVSPNSSKAARKSLRVSFSAAKSSVRKFAGAKRKRSGSDSFQRSIKRQHLESYIGSDSEKENTGSASSLSIINSSMNLSEPQETDKLFNSFVNLEKNDFTNQDISLPSKALTGPKHSLRNSRRLSAPGRFVRLLNMDSNTSTPKKLRSDTELLQKVFGENTPIVSINVNYNTNITYTENSERPSTSMASGNLSGIKRLTRNSGLISFDSPRISISKLPNLQNKESEQNAISIVHDGHEGSPVVQLNIGSQRSLIESLPSPKELLQIEGSPLKKSKSKSDVEQMTLRNSSLKVKNRSCVKQVKSPKNDLTNIKGIKKLFSTPKLRHSPRNDLSDVEGVRQLMKTPGRAPKSPKNDLTNVEGIRALMRTPKSPKNDLTNVIGVKKIISKSPRNDLSNVKGLKKLLKTPQRAKKSPRNDLTDVRGVKQLIRTPKPNPKSPKNDLTEIKGVKNLMRTPKSPKNDLRNVYGVKRIMAKSPENDLTDVRGVRNLFRSIKLKRSPRFTVSGVKKLMKSPAKKQKSPKNDLTDVTGVKNILRSPKSPPDILQNVSGIKRLVSREPSNRLSDLRGVKNILRTPKGGNSSPNDLQDTEGLSKLMQTPKPKAREPKNDLRDVQGVKQLFIHSEPRNSLSDVDGLENLFTETNSPKKYSPRKQKQSSTNTPAKVQNEINPVLNESPSYNINNMDVLFDKLRDENESSIDDAIEKLILSTPKHTYERKGKSFTPTKIGASKNTRRSLGVFREHTADVQKWVEEQKLYLKAHPEQDEKVPKEKTKVTRKRKAVEENVDVTTIRTRTRRDKQVNTNETEKSVTPRKRTRRQGNDEEDPIITTSTRSQRNKQKELTEDENATLQTSKLTNKRTRRNNAESTPVIESTGKSTRQRVKKAETESKPSTPAPEILEKARGTRRGKKQELTEANEEKEKPSQTRGKRKLRTSKDLENSEEQAESTNKKSKSKRIKASTTKHEDETTESEEQTKKFVTRTRSKRVNNEMEIEETTELPEKLNDTDVEEQKPVLKKITRNKAKNTSKDEQPEIITKTRSQAKNPKIKTNSEDSKHIEEPTTKNTRSKNKTEKDDQKENEEPEKNTKKTTRRQAKASESINKNEQEEEMKVPNTRTTRKREALTEEQATNEPEEKITRSKKRSASKKNEQEKEEETKSTEHKMSTKKSIQEQKQEEVTEPRRSARTRKAKK